MSQTKPKHMLKEMFHDIADKAKELFLEEGRLDPMLFTTVHEHGIITPVGEFMRDHATKNGLSNMLADLARAGMTEFVLVIEAWSVRARSVDEKDSKEIEAYTKSGRSLEHHPDRTEIIGVTYCRPGLEIMRQAQIIRHDDGTTTVGEWQEMATDDAGKSFSGRFSASVWSRNNPESN